MPKCPRDFLRTLGRPPNVKLRDRDAQAFIGLSKNIGDVP